MKKFLLLCLVVAFCQQLKAQSDEQIKKKSGSYLDTYPSKKRTVIRRQVIDKKFPDSNSLLIIDHKIFRGTADQLRKSQLDSLQLIQSIEDTTSVSGVKYILIYQSKKSK
jgi:hypothetical protein